MTNATTVPLTAIPANNTARDSTPCSSPSTLDQYKHFSTTPATATKQDSISGSFHISGVVRDKLVEAFCPTYDIQNNTGRG